MGLIKSHPEVKVFAAVTFSSAVDKDGVDAAIIKLLGPIELKSEMYHFSQFTNYYESEMGPDLHKQIVLFTQNIKPEILPSIKVSTNKLEEKFCKHGNRQVNIDPGYISTAKVVLATTKDYSHRIYLGQGIYGDIHLCYQHHTFQIQPWTYPDYQQPLILNFFNSARIEYLKQL